MSRRIWCEQGQYISTQSPDDYNKLKIGIAVVLSIVSVCCIYGGFYILYDDSQSVELIQSSEIVSVPMPYVGSNTVIESSELNNLSIASSDVTDVNENNMNDITITSDVSYESDENIVDEIDSDFLSTESTEISVEDSVVFEPIVDFQSVYNTAISKVDSYYNAIPENVRTAFSNSGWYYVIVDNLSSHYVQYSSIQALTTYGEHKIEIDNRDIAYSAIVHEVGHFIDYYTNYSASSSNDFYNIWSVEHDNFRNTFNSNSSNVNSVSEYFAEGFQEYVWHPDLMKQNCPQTYEYINEIVSQI